MNKFLTITDALFGFGDEALDQAIFVAKQRQKKRQEILVRQSVISILQPTIFKIQVTVNGKSHVAIYEAPSESDALDEAMADHGSDAVAVIVGQQRREAQS